MNEPHPSVKLDILAMAAHPDDVELSCSGTLMVHQLLGKRVGVVDLTRGELGTRGTAETREQEAQAAAAILNLDVRENLGLPDGFFENRREHQLALIRAIRKYRPEIVLANATEDRHPDHGRGALLIAESCFLAGLKKVETEVEGQAQAAWRPRQVYHFIQDRYIDPDFIVDISPVIERKKEAIRSFRTQFLADPSEPDQTYISTPEFFNSLMARSQMMGKMIGVAYGEGFTTAGKLGIRSFDDLIW